MNSHPFFRRLIANLTALLATMGLVTGCSNVQDDSEAAFDVTSTAVTEYKIGAGDRLEVNVWRSPDLSANVTVLPDGKISTPLVEEITAAGLTTKELAAEITKVLDVFVKNPKVTVIVSNPDSTDFQRRVRITGAINNPQSIPYREGMTVLDLILAAGGPNDFAALRKAKLFRKVSGDLKVITINLDHLLNKGVLEQNYPLQPQDHITVPERRF